MWLKTTTGIDSTSESQNRFLNIATECPACSPWSWTAWSSSTAEWACPWGMACPCVSSSG